MRNNSKKILIGCLAIVAIGAVYLAFVKPQNNSIAERLESGESNLTVLSPLTKLTGEEAVMDDEKVIFLNVWATWCGPCNMEMPGIQTLYDKYKDNAKVAFYIVSDEDAETVNPFIARKGYELPFYRFTGSYPGPLDGNAIPRTYIIYKGKILAQEIGASQWDRPEIQELIDRQISQI